MQTELIKVPRAEAAILARKYKEHRAWSQPIDWEIQRAYALIAAGKLVIRALESIKQAGVNREFLPKLALAPATAKACHLLRRRSGAMVMSPTNQFWRMNQQRIAFREDTFVFPAESFPISWNGKSRRSDSEHEAAVPIIPLHLRPRRGLPNYFILWEAEWRPVPPRDPYLLRRLGKADLWVVLAQWELTEVERAALATRI